MHLALPRQHRRGERLVDLDHVDLVERQPGAVEHAFGGGDRGRQHQPWVGAGHRELDESGAWREPQLGRLAASLMTSTAAAPSEICDELPAVTRPPSSSETERRLEPSQRFERRLAQPFVDASIVRPSAPATATISRSKRPSRLARAASRCDRTPNASISSRVMPQLVGDQLGRDALRHDAALIGVARARAAGRTDSRTCRRPSTSPSARGSSPRRRRRRPRRRRRRSRPARRSGRPAGPSRTGDRSSCPAPCRASPPPSTALRATLTACSPTCITQPSTTSSTMPGSRSLRCCSAPSSLGREVDRVPFR